MSKKLEQNIEENSNAAVNISGLAEQKIDPIAAQEATVVGGTPENDAALDDDDITRLSLDVDSDPILNLSPNTNTVYSDTLNPLTNTLHKPLHMGGEAIKNRFILERILGKGGMGMVCQALDLRKVEAEDQHPYVAIKLLTGAIQNNANAFKMLQREAKKTQALSHPNIITVYDFDRDEETIFMTMEELDGYPLDKVIQGDTDVVLDKKTAVKIIREIALALEYAHSKGIIHSDLKPGNVFYTRSGDIKVLDFGIARALKDEVNQDNFDAGDLNAITPKYASLDMFQRLDPDPRDDIYALGLIAGELLCGEHPYGGQTAPEVQKSGVKPNVSAAGNFLYKKLISKAITIDSKQRTASASRFLSSLQWAEKGLRRALVASVIVIALIAGNALLIDAVDDDIPLTDLPVADQQLVVSSISEADVALSFMDYNGALFYLEQAFAVHPSNDELEARADKIVQVMHEQLDQASTPAQRSALNEQLLELGKYKLVASNESYRDLVGTPK